MHVRLATADDAQAITELMRHDDIWPWVSDDNCDDVPADVVQQSLVFYIETGVMPILMFMDGDILAGTLILHPMNTVTCELHIGIHPDYRGEKALRFVSLAKQWCLQYGRWRKFIILVPTYNIRARALAIRAGMTREGLVTRSFFRNGKWHDQYLYGINLGDSHG